MLFTIPDGLVKGSSEIQCGNSPAFRKNRKFRHCSGRAPCQCLWIKADGWFEMTKSQAGIFSQASRLQKMSLSRHHSQSHPILQQRSKGRVSTFSIRFIDFQYQEVHEFHSDPTIFLHQEYCFYPGRPGAGTACPGRYLEAGPGTDAAVKETWYMGRVNTSQQTGQKNIPS